MAPSLFWGRIARTNVRTGIFGVLGRACRRRALYPSHSHLSRLHSTNACSLGRRSCAPPLLIPLLPIDVLLQCGVDDIRQALSGFCSLFVNVPLKLLRDATRNHNRAVLGLVCFRASELSHV